MKTETIVIGLLYGAGVGQIAIACLYEWVRKILEWDDDIAHMQKPWNRQIAHTYSRYIQGINFGFGAITLLLAPAFLDRHPIGTALALLIAIYWGIRLFIAIKIYHTRDITEKRPLYKVGAWGFNALFGYLAVVYGAVAAMHAIL